MADYNADGEYAKRSDLTIYLNGVLLWINFCYSHFISFRILGCGRVCIGHAFDKCEIRWKRIAEFIARTFGAAIPTTQWCRIDRCKMKQKTGNVHLPSHFLPHPPSFSFKMYAIDLLLSRVVHQQTFQIKSIPRKNNNCFAISNFLGF